MKLSLMSNQGRSRSIIFRMSEWITKDWLTDLLTEDANESTHGSTYERTDKQTSKQANNCVNKQTDKMGSFLVAHLW